jgi:hypothetical protein
VLALAVLHTVSTLMMTGLIWFVQLVHYPLFAYVGDQEFNRFEKQHVRRTTWIVAPLMIIEAATAIGLALLSWSRPCWWWTILGTILIVIIWGSTAFLQVPCHKALDERLDPFVVKRLIRTNWIRTIAWTVRSVLAIVILGTIQG